MKTDMQAEARRVELEIYPGEDFDVSQSAAMLDERIESLDDQSVKDMLENDANRLSLSARGWTEWFVGLYHDAKDNSLLPTDEKAREVFAEDLQRFIKTMYVDDAGDKIGNASYIRMLSKLGVDQAQILTARLNPHQR